eukprot:CAMPEP_0184746360 /NCGR_PEP_ID=MMETSP0315-20130426/8903_1 /TAXON_ID=101924 /ORGANISM="Rhodosorus marinus, Strain UTEX LB 2760" /LENGTH=67 /DNA_ID=CAMNT_0027218887 /DNA_START=440 /DNA_END=640 /DNA_ORIENTATION=+
MHGLHVNEQVRPPGKLGKALVTFVQCSLFTLKFSYAHSALSSPLPPRWTTFDRFGDSNSARYVHKRK